MLLPSTMASLFRRAFAISLAGQRFHRYTGNRRDMMSGAPIVQTNSKRPILVSFPGAWERGYHHSLHPLFPGHSHLQYFDYSVCQTFCILQAIKYWRWEVAYCKRSNTGGGKLHSASDQILEAGNYVLQVIKTGGGNSPGMRLVSITIYLCSNTRGSSYFK